MKGILYMNLNKEVLFFVVKKATTSSYCTQYHQIVYTIPLELTPSNLCHRPLFSYKDHFFRLDDEKSIHWFLFKSSLQQSLSFVSKVSMLRSHALSLYVSYLPSSKNSLIVGCHACPSRRVYILSESLFLRKTHKAFRVSVITHLIFTV